MKICIKVMKKRNHVFLGGNGPFKPGGVFTYLAERGCAALMGRFFTKNPYDGSTFLTEPKFLGFRMAKTPKIVKFLKNGPSFQEKSLKMGTLFCQNHP